MTVSSGRYLLRAFSTNSVKVKSSSTACARACLAKEALTKRVIRFFVSVVIMSIIQLSDVLVNHQ